MTLILLTDLDAVAPRPFFQPGTRIYAYGDSEGRIHGALGHIVEEDDAAVPDMPQHMLRHCVRVRHSPVPGIHTPEKQRKAPLLRRPPDGLPGFSSRGPEKNRPAPLRQKGQGVVQLLPENFLPHGIHGAVAVPVKADLVSLLTDPLCQLRVLLHPVSAEQEGGFYVLLPESVQQLPGKPAGRPVVKGQRRRPCPLRQQLRPRQT